MLFWCVFGFVGETTLYKSLQAFTQCWNGPERPYALKWLLKANISYYRWGETGPAQCQCKETFRQRKVEKSYLWEISIYLWTLCDVYVCHRCEFSSSQSIWWHDGCLTEMNPMIAIHFSKWLIKNHRLFCII